MRAFILLITLFVLVTQSYAYTLVLPNDKKCTVSSNYAFFVGRANNNESISINDDKIYIAPNGAFAHSIKLKDGDNRVVIRSNYKTQIYRFYKNKTQKIKEEPLVELPRKSAIVISDNTPLRSTPIDAGLNRMSHLFKGTELLIDGSKGEFYRVFLSKNLSAWIAKKDVEFQDANSMVPAEFITTDNKTYKNAVVQSISFTKKLPYTVDIKDDEMIFKVYNPQLSDDTVYTLNIPKPKKYKYHIFMNNGKYDFKVTELPSDLSDYTIVIDAGHGGTEKGAVGCLGDYEKDINLKIALELEKILKLNGINVLLTRYCDGNISLQERVDFAKQNDAEIFVSIHLNSIPDIPMNIYKSRGTSVYYYNANSRKLADILQKTVAKTIGTKTDGVKGASFAVIRPHDYVGVLVEVAYMTNPLDSVIYSSDDFYVKAAQGIADGILNFINCE